MGYAHVGVHECACDPGCVKTLRGITAPGILGPTVTRRAKKRKNLSSARHYDQIRFRFHTAKTQSRHRLSRHLALQRRPDLILANPLCSHCPALGGCKAIRSIETTRVHHAVQRRGCGWPLRPRAGGGADLSPRVLAPPFARKEREKEIPKGARVSRRISQTNWTIFHNRS